MSHLNIEIQPHFEDLSVIIDCSIYANFRGNTARKKPENERSFRDPGVGTFHQQMGIKTPVITGKNNQ